MQSPLTTNTCLFHNDESTRPPKLLTECRHGRLTDVASYVHLLLISFINLIKRWLHSYLIDFTRDHITVYGLWFYETRLQIHAFLMRHEDLWIRTDLLSLFQTNTDIRVQIWNPYFVSAGMPILNNQYVCAQKPRGWKVFVNTNRTSVWKLDIIIVSLVVIYLSSLVHHGWTPSDSTRYDFI